MGQAELYNQVWIIIKDTQLFALLRFILTASNYSRHIIFFAPLRVIQTTSSYSRNFQLFSLLEVIRATSSKKVDTAVVNSDHRPQRRDHVLLIQCITSTTYLPSQLFIVFAQFLLLFEKLLILFDSWRVGVCIAVTIRRDWSRSDSGRRRW